MIEGCCWGDSAATLPACFPNYGCQYGQGALQASAQAKLCRFHGPFPLLGWQKRSASQPVYRCLPQSCSFPGAIDLHAVLASGSAQNIIARASRQSYFLPTLSINHPPPINPLHEQSPSCESFAAKPLVANHSRHIGKRSLPTSRAISSTPAAVTAVTHVPILDQPVERSFHGSCHLYPACNGGLLWRICHTSHPMPLGTH
jgi:hypothetical protein